MDEEQRRKGWDDGRRPEPTGELAEADLEHVSGGLNQANRDWDDIEQR